MITIIKVGGDVVADGARNLASDIAALTREGHRVVMVHGGGPQATKLQRALGQTPNVVGGRRITDEATLEVMKMAVAGQVNVDLCAALTAGGAKPVGLHGQSALVLEAIRRPPQVIAGGGDEPVDLGLVGKLVAINHTLIDVLLDAGFTPVLACLGGAKDGAVYNINADVVACQLAVLLGADRLVLYTGTPGVLRDINDPASRLPNLSATEARALIDEGIIAGGMIPKVDEALRALETGKVGAIHIVGHLGEGDLSRELRNPGTLATALTATGAQNSVVAKPKPPSE